MHASCSEALHKVRRECGPPGTAEHEQCRRAHHVHSEPSEERTECRIVGESEACYVQLSVPTVVPQNVYGMHLFGAPSRVFREEGKNP